MTTIDTSTQVTATAYSNQRKIDRCQNGVLWACSSVGVSTDIADFVYSTDDGATWTKTAANVLKNGSGSTTQSYTTNCSFFIDLDDYCHAVFKDNSNGYLYYRRGEPNAGRTAWTWSTPLTIWSSDAIRNYPDIIAHREGTGWKAHIVYSNTEGQTNSAKASYARVNITSGGTITLDVNNISQHQVPAANTPSGYPSIDFKHTGDGKTVSGSPDLYVSFSGGQGVAGYGIRFVKAVYDAGTWTWSAQREIDSTFYVQGSDYWLCCLFDGVDVIISGRLYTGSVAGTRVYQRDAADTTTSTLVSVADNTSSYSGSFSYDGLRNIYVFGGTNVSDLQYRKYVRSTQTYESAVTMAVKSNDISYVSAKRGHSVERIDIIYTDGTASPYDVKHESIVLNTPPTAPTGISVSALDPAQTIDVLWTHADPEVDVQTGAQIEVREANGVIRFANGHSTATQSYTIPAFSLKSGQAYEVRVRTADAGGFGAWSAWIPLTTTGRIPGFYVHNGTQLVLTQSFGVT